MTRRAALRPGMLLFSPISMCRVPSPALAESVSPLQPPWLAASQGGAHIPGARPCLSRNPVTRIPGSPLADRPALACLGTASTRARRAHVVAADSESAGPGGGGIRGGHGRSWGDGDDGGEELPPALFLFVPVLHATNKGLVCWGVDPSYRDLVCRICDVGFLSFLGALAVVATLVGTSVASVLRRVLVIIALGHMVLESAVNGVILPAHRNPEKVRASGPTRAVAACKAHASSRAGPTPRLVSRERGLQR